MTTSLFGDSTVSFGLNGLLLLKSRIWIRGSHLLEPTCERGGMFTGLQVTLTFHLPGSLVFLLTQLILLYQAKCYLNSSTQTHCSHNPAVIYYNGEFDSILLLIYMILDFLVLCDYAVPLILWYSETVWAFGSITLNRFSWQHNHPDYMAALIPCLCIMTSYHFDIHVLLFPRIFALRFAFEHLIFSCDSSF